MKPKTAASISQICAQIGLVLGVGLGIGATMLPLGLVLAYWFQNPSIIVAGLAPQAIAILFTIAASNTLASPITHENLAVEAVGNLIIFFALGALLGAFALPIFIILVGGWLLYVVTRNKNWIALADSTLHRVTGIDVSGGDAHRDPKE